MKSSVVDTTESVTINGLPAARTHIDAERKLGIDLTWIAHDGLIYQVAGIAPLKRFDVHRPAFTDAVQSFRPLSAAERAGVTEKRIRLVRARAGETLDSLAVRSHSAWTKDEIAVANGLSVQDQLQENQLVKVTVAEPYESKRLR